MAAKLIHHNLQHVVRRKQLIWLSHTTATLVAYGAVIAACYFALDWGLRPEEGMPRMLLLALFLGALGYVMWHELWLMWKRFPTRDEVALEIERFFPFLRGRLVSAYQLSRSSGGGSASLIARLIDETGEIVRTLDLRSVPDRSAHNRRMALAGALALGWGVFVGLTPTGRESFPIWWERVLHPLGAVQYPAKTLVVVDGGDRIVARGDEVALRARVRGIIPADGSIWVRRGQQRWIEQPVRGSGRDFAFVQKAVVESFVYYWRLGDGRSDQYHVEVVIPAQVRGIRVRYDYPPYTRRSPGTALGGNLEGLPGTRATLAVRTNKPIRQGALLLEDGRRIPLQPAKDSKLETRHSKLGTESTTYTATIEIAKRSSYRIRLVDEYGFENRDAMQYAIEPLADEAPRVEIPNVERRRFVTPYAALPVEIHCRDDYGVAQIHLHLSIAGRKEESLDVPIRPNRRDLIVTHTIRLDQWSLAPGSELILWASAVDNCEIGKPQQSFSGKMHLEVVSPEELIRLMRERMESLFPRLEQIGKEALESKSAVEDILGNNER